MLKRGTVIGNFFVISAVCPILAVIKVLYFRVMNVRSPAPFRTLIGTLALAALGLLTVAAQGGSAASDSGTSQRISFQISTGTTTGTYFPVGELLAGLLSHPPGISRCQATNVCGPQGLIVNMRATEGSVANVRAVNSGTASSGLAQADVVALAVAGEGPFKKTGPARQIRVIANLFGEDMHLIAATKAKIKTVEDLRGKRVSLSTEGSGTIVTARAVLAAYRLPEWRLAATYDTSDKAIDMLRQGKLDALFFVGGTPVNAIDQLLEDGVAVLVPIDGAGRKRLLTQAPHLSASTIPAGTYAGSASVETVSMGALWITNATQPDNLVTGMVRALYNPLNRRMIEGRRVGTNFIELNSAAKGTAAPFHPGAARYFSEMRVMPQKKT